MRHTLYLRGLRQVDHTVFAVADGQKTYKDPIFKQTLAYSSGQQVKRSILDALADELGQARAPVTFYKSFDGKKVSQGEPHSACDPTFPDQLLGGWMRAAKRGSDGGGRPIRRRAPLSISALRPLHPTLAGVNEEKAMTFDRRDSYPPAQIIVRGPDGKVMDNTELARWLNDNNEPPMSALSFLSPEKRAYGLFVYDVAVDLRRLFSVSGADQDPELDSDRISALRDAGWAQVGDTLVAPEAERERIIPALAFALLHWSITSNQSRTFSPMPPLAVAISDRADRIASTLRADLNAQAGLERPSATVVLEATGDDKLFVTPVANGVLPGAQGTADAMDRAQAEIEHRLRAYDYER